MLLLEDATAFQLGLAAGAASIVSIGPNNLMLIREGLVGRRVALVSSLVLASESCLILASYVGASSLVVLDADVRTVLSWGGLLAICWFACRSLLAASSPGRAHFILPQENRGSCALRVLGVVWLNPMAYLELLLVPAAIGQSLGSDAARLDFIAGLILADVAGCYGYGFGGRAIARRLRNGLDVRFFDLASGLALAAVGITLATTMVYAK